MQVSTSVRINVEKLDKMMQSGLYKGLKGRNFEKFNMSDEDSGDLEALARSDHPSVLNDVVYELEKNISKVDMEEDVI
ncbi:hypothetical protein PanWU01x14_357040 [Parasponia andersonii]|uniref:Uncharacterized protein n=1 Tax=Parasponia andersonii TaxID=3476 RepID=A0A2P5A8T6_PARAD|nr:hypothetical protein PanWU01x14_357040 [Parasponia andersonii]